VVAIGAKDTGARRLAGRPARWEDEPVSERTDTWIAAWNEPDGDRRRELLAQCMSPDGELVDRRGRHTGLDVLRDRIGSFLASVPGARVVRSTDDQEVGGFVRHGFTVVQDGDARVEGLNVFELANDGSLHRVVMFFDP
jgi:hypothetical protein